MPLGAAWTWFREGIAWRLRRARSRLLRLPGARDVHWARVVMDRETDRLVRSLPCTDLAALEISGDKWRDFGFASYRSTAFPDYDICTAPLGVEAFDLVIAEQVLEHVRYPGRAARHVWQMLRPDGFFLVTTPFLLRIHNHPDDCTRWTETGLKHLLVEAGFPDDTIATGSWGNRACVRANLRRWVDWIPWLHSLHNEPDFPVVVWALARKA